MSFFSTLAAAVWPDSTTIDPSDIRDWGAVVEGFIDGNAWQTVAKQVDQAKSSDTTLADDSELAVTLAASTKYMVRGAIWFDGDDAADFKYAFSGPASPTLLRIRRKHITPEGSAEAAIAIDEAYTVDPVEVTWSEATDVTESGFIEFEGTIHNGANAGDFTFQWAQLVNDASNTRVRAGSYIEYRKVTP